jgi:hypothetical protein
LESRSEATTSSSATAATSAGASVERMQTSGPARRGRDLGSELVESRDEPLDETSHMRLDSRHAYLGDQPDTGDAGVDVRHRRRARVEPARAPVRPVALDLHVEDVLVREPARLHRHQLLDEPGRSAMNDSPAEASRYLTVPPTTASLPSQPRAGPLHSLVAVDEHQRAMLAGDP